MQDPISRDLKKLGLRVTPQRLAIMKILAGNRTHPSAESIYHQLAKEYPGLSLSTVYNTLSKLVDAEKIQELCLDPNKKRFDPCVAPHYHFYCKACGNVFDIANGSCPFLEFDPAGMKNIGGHQVDSVRIAFKGVCKDCRCQ